ncbi:MAG: HAMP domain-containing protein [Chloroflexota bacterium]|nr:MAG: HAMP domain-containing protein [Chloroflexota bacterium]
MSLRVRLAATLAFVALVTAGVVAIASPVVIGRGFAQIEAGDLGGPGPGAGQGPGPMAGLHAQQVQQETVVTLVVIALAAAAAASIIGIVLAGRIVEPLGRLGAAAAAVARGDLGRRSGLADRSDEIGALGRSFDAMATDLEQAEASRRRFLQDAAHELKTPLAVIDATTTAVIDGVYSHEDRHLQTIRDQSRLLARIVDDLRTISLAEAGELPLRRERIAVDELAAEVTAAFAARAVAADIRLAGDVAPGLLVHADPDRLKQVLGALLDNAIRHTPPGGAFVVEGRSSSDSVRIGVRDSGPGVQPADLAHIFERFYQADPARDRSTGTSGLGLSIVRAIIDAHGGAVGAENVDGGGARIWVELPAAQPPASGTPPAHR